MMIKVRKRKIQEEEKMAEIYDIAILGAELRGSVRRFMLRVPV